MVDVEELLKERLRSEGRKVERGEKGKSSNM